MRGNDMTDQSRRNFLRRGSLGLAAIGAGALLLRADVPPTASSGGLGDYGDYLKRADEAKPAGQAVDHSGPHAGATEPRPWRPTEPNILGPFHRAGAPFRAKITPPLEPGRVLVISGTVFGIDTRRPLPNTVIDIWQANEDGRYDNDDPRNPPAAAVFLNRARLITDENGHYEYETVYPGQYRIGPDQWRPSHIHYWVRHPQYRELVTQLYFRGDPHNETDPFILPSLIIDLHERAARRGRNAAAPAALYHSGQFDVVLAN
jgi:catechol 1,2-dioxygenase